MERREPGLKSSLLARLQLQLPDRLQSQSGGAKKEESPFSHLPPPHRYQGMGQRHPQCYLVSLSARWLQWSASGSRGSPYAQNRARPLFAMGEWVCRLTETQGSVGIFGGTACNTGMCLMHVVAVTDRWYEE